jgi:hypothetical protein
MSEAADNPTKSKRGAHRKGVAPKNAWPKGVSGNPSGLSTDYNNFRRACREHGPKALATLVAAMDEGGNVAVAAAKVVVEYGYGRAPAAPEDLAAMQAARPLAAVSDAMLERALTALAESDEKEGTT